MSPNDSDDKLSAEEISALTEAFAEGQRDPRASHEVAADAEPVVLRYDLFGAGGGQRHDFPALDLIHETFSLQLQLRMERETRSEADFHPVAPDLLNFSEIYAGLEMPTAIVVCEVGGLGCTGLLLLDPDLLVHFFDLLMGGPGGPSDAADLFNTRTFTGTERLLLKRVVGFISGALSTAWKEIANVDLEMKRAEVDPRHAAVFNPSDRVALLEIEVEWDEVAGSIRLVLPMAAMRPFEKRLALTTVSPPLASDTAWREQVETALTDVPIELVAVLGEANLTLRDLLALEPGDLLRLDRDPAGVLEMRVEGVPKLAVRPTVTQGNMAAEIVGVLLGDGGVGAYGDASPADEDDGADDDDDDGLQDDAAPSARPTEVP